MANTLSKTGIIPGTVVQASYVSQSIDAFTGVVPYNLSLNGNFYINGIVNATNGSLTGSLNASASYAVTASNTLNIDSPVSWSLYAISASYSEGVLSSNVPTSSIPSNQPSVIIAGRGTILSNENVFEVYNPFFNGKTLNNNVWVTLIQRAPYPENTNFGTTCVVPLNIVGNTLTFSVSSGTSATSDLIFDFIIIVQR
jgi:hypothetical protein